MTTQHNSLLSGITTFKVGGPAETLITCTTPDDLIATLENLGNRRFMIVGGGSNIVFSDEGYAGTVIRYANSQQLPYAISSNQLHCSAALSLDHAALWAAEQGWSGLEFASGIPGTVGGAIAGNAGAFGRAMADVVESVTWYHHADKTIQTRPISDLYPTYRYTSIKTNHHVTILSCVYNLNKSDTLCILNKRKEILQLRQEKHPDLAVFPCAGSTFKNLDSFDDRGIRQAAGLLLEQVHAKTFRSGGAGVFSKHANMVISQAATCTATDILAVMRRMRAAVQEKFGITLEPEIQLLDYNGTVISL